MLLGCQPATLFVVLDNEVLHSALIATVHHQAYILCFITFVTNHRVESASNDLGPKWQIAFIFGIQNFSIF